VTAKTDENGQERRISQSPCRGRSYPLLTDAATKDLLYPHWYPTRTRMPAGRRAAGY